MVSLGPTVKAAIGGKHTQTTSCSMSSITAKLASRSLGEFLRFHAFQAGEGTLVTACEMDLTSSSIGFLNEPEFSPGYGMFMPLVIN